jgi:hypothetical protein
MVLAGCKPPPPRVQGAYFGPTVSLSELVQTVNANNLKIGSLWARATVDAWLVDERKRETFVNADNATLLYRAAGDFRFDVSDSIKGNLFDLGVNESSYWMRARGEVDTMWWGRVRMLGQPCTEPIPIQPILVSQVLGVGTFGPNLLAEPAPVMRFDNDNDAYAVTWHVRFPERWVAQREVWYDRATLRPRRVILYDEHGRALVRARLGEHAAVEGANGGTIAHAYELDFPDSGTRMRIRLRQAGLDNGRGVPNDRSFALPAADRAGVKNVNQIDAACGS